MFQTLIIRDWWFCMVISLMFEVMEYTLEHQLPNFSECWWDHVSSTFLIYGQYTVWSALPMLTLILLKMKEISLCHHYIARPTYTSVQSDQALYCWLTYFDFPKNDNEQFQKWQEDYSI